VKYAANTKRVLRFVFRAVRDFIIERAEALRSVTVCGGAHVTGWKSEDFRERMFRLRMICHAGEILRDEFDFIEQNSQPKRQRTLPCAVKGSPSPHFV
jgi:hypothetical protein